MRVDAIRNYGHSFAVPKNTKPSSFKHAPLSAIQHDTATFKQCYALKGAGLGAALGLASLGALSLFSGGMATPLAYGLYALAFGTAGGITGSAIDQDAQEAG